MELTDPSILGASAGLIVAIGSAYLTIKKIAKENRKEKKATAAEILQHAKEEISLKEKELEAKIAVVDAKLEGLRESVNKDFAHVRETYSGEIHNLASKIEDLREDLRGQHSQMVALLTKMIGTKE